MKNTSDFFSKEQQNKIVQAIKEAELNTSGEIKVHIEKKCKGDVLDRAAFIFKKLRMHKTKLRNGVLIYLAIEIRKFAIIGDAGINSKVPENFWDNIKDNMLEHFKNENFTEGLTEAILIVGNQLKTYFPFQKDDVNEINDEISFE